MFLTNGKSNWFYLSVVLAVALIIGGGVLYELETIKIELTTLNESINRISKPPVSKTINQPATAPANNNVIPATAPVEPVVPTAPAK